MWPAGLMFETLAVQKNPGDDLPPLLLMTQSLMPFSRRIVTAQRLAA